MRLQFTREKCIEARKILGRDSTASAVWRNNFAPSNKIGNCTNLYRKLAPSSCEDFFEKYIRYAANNRSMPIRDRGLDESGLSDVARDYKSLSENGRDFNVNEETYLWDAICHIIVETWDGQKNEREFRNFLEGLGYSCSDFDGLIDGKYGMDIKVTRSDGKVSAIQIKPVSFFLSNRWDVRRDRVNLCHKYENAKNELGIKTYYAIYRQDRDTGETLWAKNGDGFRYKIDELFSYRPDNINDSYVQLTRDFKFHYLPKDIQLT